jgi:hypothetical protein
MAMLSITEAARQAGVSRQYFYTKYLKAGMISVNRDTPEPRIDSDDLLRVFNGVLPGPKVKVESIEESVRDSSSRTVPIKEEMIITELLSTIADLRQQLEFAQDREIRLWSQIENLTNALQSIEHKPTLATATDVSDDTAAPETAQKPLSDSGQGTVFNQAEQEEESVTLESTVRYSDPLPESSAIVTAYKPFDQQEERSLFTTPASQSDTYMGSALFNPPLKQTGRTAEPSQVKIHSRASEQNKESLQDTTLKELRRMIDANAQTTPPPKKSFLARIFWWR